MKQGYANHMPLATPQMSTVSYSLQNQTPINSMKNSEPVLVQALGALLTLSVALLAVVTTGWVCTCMYTHKKETSSDSETVTTN